MRGLVLLPLLLLTAGCWQPRYFTPRENLNGTGPEGDASAVYEVQNEKAAATKGQVRLWSGGAKARFDENDNEVVDLHVGFEIENTGEAPLELDLDKVGLEEVFIDGYLKAPLMPQSVSGSATAAPGLTTRVDLVFRPPTTYPSDVDSFAVRFVVRDGDGNDVGQVTPFVPVRTERTRNASWGWGPAWGWGGPFGPYYGGYWGGYGWWGGYGGLRCR